MIDSLQDTETISKTRDVTMSMQQKSWIIQHKEKKEKRAALIKVLNQRSAGLECRINSVSGFIWGHRDEDKRTLYVTLRLPLEPYKFSSITVVPTSCVVFDMIVVLWVYSRALMLVEV